MFVPLQFDPNTGCIMCNRSLVPGSRFGNIINNLIDSGLDGRTGNAIKAIGMLGDNERLLSIDFLSAVWHEKKHFVDWLLTNYSAYRFRSMLEVYINLPMLIHASKNVKMAIPLDLNHSSVLREVYELDQPSGEIAGLIGNIARKKALNIEDSIRFTNSNGYFNLNGNAMLEALAYQAQSASINTAFGLLLTEEWGKASEGRTNYNVYRWLENILVNSGLCDIYETRQGLFINAPLYGPIIYAALCIDTLADNKDEMFCMYRFNILITELKNRVKKAKPQNTREAWDLVNEICSKKFHKTIIEGMKDDIQFTDRMIDQMEAKNDHIYLPVLRIARSYQSLRKSMVNEFCINPEIVFDSDQFFYDLLPRLSPLPVNIVNGSMVIDPDMNDFYYYWNRSFKNGEKINSLSWGWSEKIWPSMERKKQSNLVVLSDIPSWQEIVNHISPLAKVMVNGFNDPTIMGPELAGVHRLLHVHGNSFFVPKESKSAKIASISTIEAFKYITQREQVICDFCCKPVDSAEAVLVSPFEAREDDTIISRIKNYMDEKSYQYLLATDWSYWIVHKESCPE